MFKRPVFGYLSIKSNKRKEQLYGKISKDLNSGSLIVHEIIWRYTNLKGKNELSNVILL